MRKYSVNINGTNYEIEIEEITGTTPSYASASAPAARPAAPVRAASAPVTHSIPSAPAPAPKPASAPAAAGGRQVTAPMPGNVLSVKVTEGQAVKKGDILIILEAMKMENEIMAPCDGTVTSLSVTAGTSVTSGALICAIS